MLIFKKKCLYEIYKGTDANCKEERRTDVHVVNAIKGLIIDWFREIIVNKKKDTVQSSY